MMVSEKGEPSSRSCLSRSRSVASCPAPSAGAFIRIPQTWIAGAAVLGALVLVAFYGAVSGANIIRDMREAIVNTIGGRMTKYEALLDDTIARALETLSARARSQGYDGVVGIRVSHPMITSGAIEVVVTGTGFRFANKQA